MSWAEVKKINNDLNIPLDELVKSGKIPIIKSVQSGTSNLGTTAITVTINKVNRNKAVILTQRYGTKANSMNANTGGSYGFITSDTTIQVFSYGGDEGRIWWQVIEFY